MILNKSKEIYADIRTRLLYCAYLPWVGKNFNNILGFIKYKLYIVILYYIVLFILGS